MKNILVMDNENFIEKTFCSADVKGITAATGADLIQATKNAPSDRFIIETFFNIEPCSAYLVITEESENGYIHHLFPSDLHIEYSSN